MSALAQLRCSAPHPTIPGFQCRALLATAPAGSVEVRTAEEDAEGCALLRCRRCGTEYLLCPVERRKSA